jgi:hypothetical protein
MEGVCIGDIAATRKTRYPTLEHTLNDVINFLAGHTSELGLLVLILRLALALLAIGRRLRRKTTVAPQPGFARPTTQRKARP